MTIFTNFAKLFCSGEITMYKIYVLSSKESQLPYEVEGVKNDLSKEIKWKFIGEVDDYEIAKYMVEHDRCYAKKMMLIIGLIMNLIQMDGMIFVK